MTDLTVQFRESQLEPWGRWGSWPSTLTWLVPETDAAREWLDDSASKVRACWVGEKLVCSRHVAKQLVGAMRTAGFSVTDEYGYLDQIDPNLDRVDAEDSPECFSGFAVRQMAENQVGLFVQVWTWEDGEQKPVWLQVCAGSGVTDEGSLVHFRLEVDGPKRRFSTNPETRRVRWSVGRFDVGGALIKTLGEVSAILNGCIDVAEQTGPDAIDPSTWAEVTRTAADKLTSSLNNEFGDRFAELVHRAGMDDLESLLLLESLGLEGRREE